MPAMRNTLGGTTFSEYGEGEALVLLHDGVTRAETVATLMAQLPASFHLIVPNLPDGETSERVQQVRRLLDDLNISSANLIGVGRYGPIAMGLAAAKPQRVKRLAIIDGEEPGESFAAASILCSALFLTSDASMATAEALARSAIRARVSLAGDASAEVTDFLAERLSNFDSRELRTAFGSFMTGVTIVTTTGTDGQPRGFTANSFTSVSIEPPLLLICVGKTAASIDIFRQARGFAVNILSEAQKDVSVLFASKRPDKFENSDWRPGPFGNPLIEGSAAWFDCARYQVIDSGDHIILMGHVEAFSYSDSNPLGYARGGYITLGLEQAAVNAASSSSRTVVGAILESEGKLVLLPDPSRPNGLALPEVGRSGDNGSASQLHALLAHEGIDATLGFLFAVFENPGTKQQCIVYRGEALLHQRGRTVLADFEQIPWDRLPDEATRSMLRRYAAERKIGRFKIYSGDHRQGTVMTVD